MLVHEYVYKQLLEESHKRLVNLDDEADYIMTRVEEIHGLKPYHKLEEDTLVGIQAGYTIQIAIRKLGVR